jgi:hypothetical protein
MGFALLKLLNIYYVTFIIARVRGQIRPPKSEAFTTISPLLAMMCFRKRTGFLSPTEIVFAVSGMFFRIKRIQTT